nr:hypothetical protein BaRGS_011422 [Batillaria attramentaria]
MRNSKEFSMSKGGKNTVARIFCNRPDEKHLMKEKPIKISSDLMDIKAFEKSRQLELLRYEVRKLTDQLQDKRDRLAEAKDLMEADLEGNKIKNYLQAQNRVELMKMRYMDARNTARYFKRIIQTLKKDIFEMGQRIQTMQKTRREKAVVVEDLAKIRADQMKPFHAMVEQKMREFESTLRRKKKEHVEQNRETIQKCNAETKVESVEEERPGCVCRGTLARQQAAEYGNMQTGSRDILSRVEEEHARYTRLCQQLEESNNHYDMLHDDLGRLRGELQVLMYDTKAPGMRVFMLSGKCMGERCMLEGDPIKDMEVIWNKTEKLIEQYGGKKVDEEQYEKKDITNFAELRLPGDNLRTTLRSLDYRSHDNLLLGLDDTQVGYVSRDDIKKRAADILKPKKKGGSQNRVNTDRDFLAMRVTRDKIQEGQKRVSEGDWSAARFLFEEALGASSDPHDVKNVQLILDEVKRYQTCAIAADCTPSTGVDWDDLLERRPVESLFESWHDTPQSVFFIRHEHHTLPTHDDIAGHVRFSVGRRILSHQFRSGKIRELHCSLVTPSMLLGVLEDQRMREDGVVLYFRSYSDHEKMFVMQPGTLKELSCRPDGWDIDEPLAEQLGEGEVILRQYAQIWLKSLERDDLRLYDPACSTGQFLSSMRSAVPKAHLIGQDLSAQMVSYAKKRLDEIHCGNAIEPKVPENSVDVCFVRFLNSEVVKVKDVLTILEPLSRRVKVGGHLIIFGHTPVLLSAADLRRMHGWRVEQSLGGGAQWGGVFQFYVVKRVL